MHTTIRRSLRLASALSRRAFLVLLATGLLVPGLAPAASLTILHTNDTHGHLLPFSYPSFSEPGSAQADLSDRRDIGGIARRATLVKEIRQEQEAKGIPVWLVDAGDFCDGTPFSIEYHGEADLAAMNAAGYDFGTLGNHEFNNSLEQTRKFLTLAKYPVLCANATLKSTGEPLAPAYKIETVGPLRVALFGLLTRETATYPAAKEGVAIADEIETAGRMVEELRPKADILVLLSHCGKTMDEQIAREVPGIDVIIGGHSHSRLPSGEFVWRSEDLVADAVNGTVIVQAFQWGGELGRLDLLFEKDPQGAWHVDRYRERLIPITSAIAPDSEVAAVVDQYWKPIAPKYEEVVGQATADFAGRGDDLAEYNLVADAVRETFGTDVEFENLGGVRAPLLQGTITRGNLIDLDPFQNTVVTFKLTGSQIRAILEKSKPAVSGLRYRMENGQIREVTVGGQPLENLHVYTGAANSYFAGHALKGMNVQDTGKLRSDVVYNYIKEKDTISPAYDGRRVVIGR